MSTRVQWSSRARRDLKKLDPQVRRRAIDAILRLAETGEGDVKRLSNFHPPEYRLRVGDWRVRFGRDHETDDLLILRVLPRGKAY